MKELETAASMWQIKTLKSDLRSPHPRFFWQAGIRACRREMKMVGGVALKTSFRVKKNIGGNWPLVSYLACLQKVVATPPSSSLLCQQFFLSKTRTGQHVPSGHSPGRIQIVRGRWEAAERQLEPWWAVCHPAHHPLFPLWPGFLLPCSQHSLEVPQNMYPLENIYNFLTSWEFGFFFQLQELQMIKHSPGLSSQS